MKSCKFGTIVVSLVFFMGSLAAWATSVDKPTQPFIQVRMGHLDHRSLATWSCLIRADHPALAPLLSRAKVALAAGRNQKLAVAYHIMPQIPSVQIYAETQDTKVSGAAARPLLLFEDFEQIHYRPDETLLHLAKVAVGICGFHYTAFDLPTGEDALIDETSVVH